MKLVSLREILLVSVLLLIGCGEPSKMSETIYEIKICYESLGRSPEEVENDIAIPVESILEKIDGVSSISSNSSINSAEIVIEHSRQYDIEKTINIIERELVINQSELPKDIPAPIVLHVTSSSGSIGCK